MSMNNYYIAILIHILWKFADFALLLSGLYDRFGCEVVVQHLVMCVDRGWRRRHIATHMMAESHRAALCQPVSKPCVSL